MKNKGKLSITAIDRERDTDREKLKISLADTQEKQVGRQANRELEKGRVKKGNISAILNKKTT